MHSKNQEIKINDKADKVIQKLFKSLLNRFQIFDCVNLFYYNC